MKLDVTITAIVRPEILRMTLHTFRKNLLREFDVRVIVNVDPIGELETHSQMDVVEITREFFGDVVYRTPTTPSFSGAVQWCWSQVETDLFFHLEDDFILRRKFSAAELLTLFDDPKVSGVTLNRRTKKSALRWLKRNDGDGVRVYDGDYYYHPEISLNPSLFRTAHLKPLAAKLTPDFDPEYQLIKFRRSSDGIFLMHTKPRPSTIDIGSTWRKRHGLRKEIYGSGETYLPIIKHSWRRVVTLTVRFYVRKWIWKLRYCR